MKNTIIYLFIAMLLVVACKEEKKDTAILTKDLSDNIKPEQDSIAYTMLKTQCYICHSITAPSHDDIIAPPLAAVKRRYSMQFDSKEEFVNAVVKWTLNPTKENALMRGAVLEFNVMPKQNFKEEEIRKIAAYVYDNELETPKWFEAHEKEVHGEDGMGRGRKGRGMGRKN